MQSFAKLKKLSTILSSNTFAAAWIRHGTAAGVEHLAALRTMQALTVIDIGANTGQFSLVARYTFPEAQIHAFEPIQECAQKYQRLLAGDPKILLHPHALGCVSDSREMHISASIDSSSLLPIGEKQTTLFPGTKETGKQIVEVRRLEDCLDFTALKPPILVKIDVQGYELEVLNGLSDAISRVDYLYCECSFVELYQGQALASEVISWLHARNLNVVGVYNTTYSSSGKAIQADILFQRIGREDSEGIRMSNPIQGIAIPDTKMEGGLQ